MGATRNGRVLGAALAISLAVHLVLAGFIHVRPVEATAYRATPVIVHIYVHPKHTPPPQLQPRIHAAAQHVAQDVRRPDRRPHVPSTPNGVVASAPPLPTGEPHAPGNTGPTGPGGAPGQTDGPPTPPGPECSVPNAEAKTVIAISPDRTVTDSTVGTNVTAMIKVDLDAAGRVTGVSIYRSSGSLELDQAAMAAARESTYAPETRDCQPVAGSYLFKVEFSD
jgi:TonB family protein